MIVVNNSNTTTVYTTIHTVMITVDNIHPRLKKVNIYMSSNFQLLTHLRDSVCCHSLNKKDKKKNLYAVNTH